MHTINNFFDKIFVINLDARDDRWQTVTRTLKSFDIWKYERFDAYNGKLFQDFVDPKIRVRRNGAYIGCLLSHLEIIRRAKAHDWKNVLIFEDDLNIHKNLLTLFDRAANEILERSPDWDIWMLGQAGFNNYYTIETDDYSKRILDQTHHRKMISPAIQAWGMHAYAVNQKFYDVIIDNYNQGLQLELDVWLNQEIFNKGRNDYKCFVTNPQLFMQYLSDSDNENRPITLDWTINRSHSCPADYIPNNF